MRKATLRRTTGETDISISLTIDGTGRFEGTSGIGFFDHMLHLLARHSGMDISLTCKGDLNVDNHHTIEDIGITLGETFEKALGIRRGSIAMAASSARWMRHFPASCSIYPVGRTSSLMSISLSRGSAASRRK